MDASCRIVHLFLFLHIALSSVPRFSFCLMFSSHIVFQNFYLLRGTHHRNFHCLASLVEENVLIRMSFVLKRFQCHQHLEHLVIQVIMP